MIEFAFRLLGAGLVILVSGWFGTPNFSHAWPIALWAAAYGSVAYGLEQQNKRNPGIAGLTAAADAISIAFLLASCKQIESFGFLTLFPCIYAYRRYAAKLPNMAAIASAAILVAQAAIGPHEPTPALYIQTVGILILGLLFNRTAQTVVIRETVENESGVVDATSFLAVRENFRRLKDFVKELEDKSRKDRFAVLLYECKYPKGAKFFTKLSQKVQEVSGAESIAIYSLAMFDQTMVVRGTSGDLPENVEDQSFCLDLSKTTKHITENVEMTLRATLDDRERAKAASILLLHEGKVMGMMNVFHGDWEKLREAKLTCEDLAPLVASLIDEEQQRRSDSRKLQEVELLYETSIVTAGATDRKEMADRIVQKLPLMMSADFIGIYFLNGKDAELAAAHNREIQLLDAMSFAEGPGIKGWLGVGAPDLGLYRASDDQRCDPFTLKRRRVGSFLLCPLQFGEEPFGFIVAASRAEGSLDVADFYSLRAIAAEFSQAVARIECPSKASFGLTSSANFQTLAGSGRPACLVYLELLKKQQLLDSCGSDAVDNALRTFARRLRGKLPLGAAACQRPQGDFMVYLPEREEGFTTSWANDLAATANMIAVNGSHSKKSYPLAFRARVAVLGQQSQEVFTSATH